MIFDCHQSIKKILDFNQAPAGESPQLNIAWGVDKNFMFGASISIFLLIMWMMIINRK